MRKIISIFGLSLLITVGYLSMTSFRQFTKSCQAVCDNKKHLEQLKHEWFGTCYSIKDRDKAWQEAKAHKAQEGIDHSEAIREYKKEGCTEPF
jgi:hypothetical protein